MRQNQKRTKKVFSILTAGAVILTTFGSPAGSIESKAETAYGIEIRRFRKMFLYPERRRIRQKDYIIRS